MSQYHVSATSALFCTVPFPPFPSLPSSLCVRLAIVKENLHIIMNSNFNNINSLQNEIKSIQYYTIRDFLSAFSTCANNTKNSGDNENSSSTETAINNENNSNINDNNNEDNNSNNNGNTILYNKDSRFHINNHLSLLHINSRSISKILTL